ncbi:uncharacterized protein FIBRA_01012 [Fibroporia radiculosa]|uniref:EKC/KEOPS complex subunit CGI121 n=1 Tax=Fibroporia radiculosa TaxID=599839 RepID=J4H0V4_9APHY|nr:uncharacterized protein FIBRA_01012 [Fibroporia radiculosa]CCL99004.1 predicted protein [Fibroporia radiculosa]
METFRYAHFPLDSSVVHVALFTNVSNAAQLRSRIVRASTMVGPEGDSEREAVNYAFIDARLICSVLHLQTAIVQAILAHAEGILRTKTIHSEILWALSPNNNITEAIKRFGVSDNMTALMVVRIASPGLDHVLEGMQAIVSGTLSPIHKLGDVTDWAGIRKLSIDLKYYKLNNDPALKVRSNGDAEREHAIINEIVTSTGARDRSAVGVFTPKTAAVFVATAVGLYFYFRYEKQKLLEQRQKELDDKQVGRPNVGGAFSLTTHENKPFTEQDLRGKWNLVYFGFTNCPDICPEELDKMSAAVHELDKQYGPIVQPIFISVDPARDSIKQVARYVSEFHPRLVGLTGDYASVKATCKAYRVYFSTPPDARADDDYLVDHSIFFYFMDPNGKFVDAFGKATTCEEVIARVQKEITQWEESTGKRV